VASKKKGRPKPIPPPPPPDPKPTPDDPRIEKPKPVVYRITAHRGVVFKVKMISNRPLDKATTRRLQAAITAAIRAEFRLGKRATRRPSAPGEPAKHVQRRGRRPRP
jgi:hypothetical protein